MSVANQDNAPSHLPNPVGNDGGIGLSLQPLPLAPLVVSDLHANLNLNPSSTRTSVTRVENDEEGRLRPSMTSEPVAIVAETTPAPAHVHGANSAPRASPVHEEERDSGQSTPEPTRIEPDGEQVRVAGAEGEGDAVPQTPQTYVTFLVISGKRRTLAFEPSTTVGRVKELVWNSWSAGVLFRCFDFRFCVLDYLIFFFCLDWQDERPPAPSYLRVLYLGRLLQDDETLSSRLSSIVYVVV